MTALSGGLHDQTPPTNNWLKGAIVTLLVFVITILCNQMYGQQETVIRVDTLRKTSCPVFFMNSDSVSFVILDTGTYDELRYGTAYAEDCLQENEELQYKAIVSEVHVEQYQGVLETCKSSLHNQIQVTQSYKEENSDLRIENANYAVSLSQSEKAKKGWRTVAVGAVFVAIIEGVILILR